MNQEEGGCCCLVRPASSEEEEPLLAPSMLIGQEDPKLLGGLFCKGPNPVSKGSNYLLIPSQPISHWVLAPAFWRRHIQTRALDFIDTLNYSSWVATDGSKAESQIHFYRETLQGTSVMCTLLCILKSLFLVE